MKVLEGLQYVRQRLEQAGQEEAQRKAKLLLSFALDCEPLDLVTKWRQDLQENEIQQLDSSVERLLGGEPLQYVLGEAGFMGLNFAVGPPVLIPRPDTEVVVEKAIELFKDAAAPCIADIGTGSGAIAVSLAHHLPRAQVHGVDVAAAVLEYAQKNAQANWVERRCHFYEGDLCAPLAALGLKFDLIVSNPPYITAAEMAGLPADVKHEPALALAGGADGLDFYRRLALETAPLLKDKGWLLVEHGWQQQEQVAALLAQTGWLVAERFDDYGGRARGILALRMPPHEPAAVGKNMSIIDEF